MFSGLHFHILLRRRLNIFNLDFIIRLTLLFTMKMGIFKIFRFHKFNYDIKKCHSLCIFIFYIYKSLVTITSASASILLRIVMRVYLKTKISTFEVTCDVQVTLLEDYECLLPLSKHLSYIV